VRVVWHATQAPNQDFYYWNSETNVVTWDPPWVPGSAAAPATSNVVERMRAYERPRSGWCFQTVIRGANVPAERIATGADSDDEGPTPPQGKGGAGALEPLWVEVETSAGEMYYWDARNDVSASALPPLARVSWIAQQQAQDEPFYYKSMDSGEVVWNIPGLARSHADFEWVQVGSAVMLNGLPEDFQRYENQMGTVVNVCSHCHAEVRLPDNLGGPIVRVTNRNLIALAANTIVEFHSLENVMGLNGTVGTVTHEAMDSDKKICVQLSDKSVKRVCITKIRPLCHLWGLDLQQAQTESQLPKEQKCTFVDGDGDHHTFLLHLPTGFLEGSRRAKRRVLRPWPLLIYLHGNGGGSFFSYGKKALRSVGLTHASERFVVCSPACDWSWKQTPRPWILQLLQQLRAASWIDVSRVYVTGCSMGGMGVWEFASMAPELVTAIAPVAAYHQADRTEIIAKQLKGTPTLAVHSLSDSTCPLTGEERLWDRLQQLGNAALQVSCAPSVDHCHMFDRTYCDDITLYEWLLSHRRPKGPGRAM